MSRVATLRAPTINTPQKYQHTLAAQGDAMIWAAFPTFNYGASTTFGCGNDGGIFRAFIQFNLTSIPVNSRIISATVRLYCQEEKNTTDRVINLHRALTEWYESIRSGEAGLYDGSTWNLRNAKSGANLSWGAAGGQSGTDYAASSSASATVMAANTWVEWDVTSDVRTWLQAPGDNLGWWLINASEATADSSKKFTSSDGATAANRPQLVIVYENFARLTAPPVLTATALPDVPLAINQHGFEYLDGKLYVVGGENNTPDESVKVYAWDIAGASWAERADLPAKMQSPGVRAVNGKLYCIGGMADDVLLDEVYEYDPGANTWTAKTVMPTPREDFGTGVIDNKIYCFGGLRAGQTPLATLQIYDPALDSWDETKSDMPDKKLLGDFGASYNGRLYAFGAANSMVGYPVLNRVNTVYQYNPGPDQWLTLAPMPEPRCYAEAVEVRGKLFVIAGARYTNAVGIKTIYAYDPVTNGWTRTNHAPYAARGVSAAAVGDSIYICGGYGDAGYLASFYRLDVT